MISSRDTFKPSYEFPILAVESLAAKFFDLANDPDTQDINAICQFMTTTQVYILTWKNDKVSITFAIPRDGAFIIDGDLL